MSPRNYSSACPECPCHEPEPVLIQDWDLLFGRCLWMRKQSILLLTSRRETLCCMSLRFCKRWDRELFNHQEHEDQPKHALGSLEEVNQWQRGIKVQVPSRRPARFCLEQLEANARESFLLKKILYGNQMFAGNILMGNILISSLSVNLFYFFFRSVENLWLKKKK